MESPDMEEILAEENEITEIEEKKNKGTIRYFLHKELISKIVIDTQVI